MDLIKNSVVSNSVSYRINRIKERMHGRTSFSKNLHTMIFIISFQLLLVYPDFIITLDNYTLRIITDLFVKSK